MSKITKSMGQLSVFEYIFCREISSRDLRKEMIRKLATNDPQLAFLKALDRFARQRKTIYFYTEKAVWKALLVRKTKTGRYRWDLSFRPVDALA